MSDILNAKITGTMLGIEDHGLFTCFLYLDLSNGYSIGFGGYVLGGESGLKFIERILEVVGVDEWENLEGKHVRVIDQGLGRQLKCIGSLMKDEWLDPKEFFEKIKEDCDHCYAGGSERESYCKHCGKEL